MSAVGIIIRALSIGGAEKQCLLLASELQHEYDVHLFIQKSDPLTSRYMDFIQKHKIAHTFLNGSLYSRHKQLNEQIKQRKIKVLLSYLPLDNLISAMVKIKNRDLVVVGGIRNSQLSRGKFLINRFLHRHIHDYTLFNNYSGLESFLKKGFKKEKTFVIHNRIDRKYNERECHFTNSIHILSVSRFQKFKDHRTALEAIHHLRYELVPERDFKYSLLGFGPQKEAILNWIEQFKLSDCVDLVESPPDVDEYYKKAHIYLSSSLYEGLSNSIMEALNYSLPVVATDVGDSGYLVKQGINGFLTQPGDPKDIANKLYYLLSNPAKIEQFGKNSYLHLHENFSPEKFTERYIQLIQSIIQDEEDKN